MANNAIICPGCNAFYKADDFSEKKIKCSRCGREIGKESFLHVEDEKNLLQEFVKLRKSEADNSEFYNSPFYVKYGAGILVAGIIVYRLIAGLHNPIWLYFLFLFFGVFFPFIMKLYSKNRKEFEALVEECNYDLEKISERISKSGSQSLEIEYDNLIPYIKSRGEIKERYRNDVVQGEKVVVREHEFQEEHDVYIKPPSICPSCDFPYKANLLEQEFIKCEKCGYEIKCLEAEKQIIAIKKAKEFLQKIGKNPDENYSYYGGLVAGVLCLFFLFKAFVKYQFSLLSLFHSWYIILFLFMIAFFSLPLANIRRNKTFKKYASMDSIDLVELDILMEIEHKAKMNGIDDDTMNKYYKLRKDINHLYKTK